MKLTDKSNTMKLSIRLATNADCELINKLASTAFPATYGSLLSAQQLAYMMEWMYAVPAIRKQMAEEGHTYLLAFMGEKPVGYASVQPQSEDVCTLQKIYLLPEAQGSHRGQQLFEAALALVRTAYPTAKRVELHVNRHNPALGFYEHLGMKIVAEGDFDIGNGYQMNVFVKPNEQYKLT